MSDPSQLIPIDEPFPTDPAQAPAPDPPDTDESEPEGVIVQGDKRLIDVSILAAERKRVREATEKRIREQELTPLQQREQAAQQALNEARPYIDIVRANPQLLQQPKPTSYEDQIGDDEAAQEARDLQLYDAQSQLDLKTAKRIIAKRRSETQYAAQQAAQEAIAPMQQVTAEQASRENFYRCATMTDQTGQPLVDPQILAQVWVQLGPDMTQHPQIAEVALERAMGVMVRQGKRPPALRREPVYSEAPGGRAPGVQLTDSAKRLGLTKQDLERSSKTFVAGGVSPIGEW